MMEEEEEEYSEGFNEVESVDDINEHFNPSSFSYD